MPTLEYTASPTVAKFMKSKAFGRLILGPVGSGKTTGCIMDLLAKACTQSPAPNGLRYTRFPIVRQTLKQLKDTVLKDCQSRLSSIGIGQWKVSDSTFYIDFENVKSEWVFIPLEDAREQARLLSMQASGAWMSEFTEINLDVLQPLQGRLGRYPNDVNVGFCDWNGIIGDSNMPMEGSEWWKFLETLPPDWQKFKQPSGLEPPVYKDGRQISGAENLDWLLQTDETLKLPFGHPLRIARGKLYYQRSVDQWGIDDSWVKRYIKAEYGDDPSGEAVFRATFRSSFHTADDTQLIPGYPLLIGQDFGRNPWSIICQVDHYGRLVVHEEVPAYNIGLEKHLNENLRPRLINKYLGYKHALIGDPAGIAKDSHSEENSFDLLQRCGFAAYPAPTNDIDPRIRSVEALLGKSVNGGPGLVINRRGAPTLVRAMAGGYRYLRTQGGQGALKAVPDKNDPEGYSHVADTLQYVSLVVHGQMIPDMVKYLWPAPKAPRARISPAAWT